MVTSIMERHLAAARISSGIYPALDSKKFNLNQIITRPVPYYRDLFWRVSAILGLSSFMISLVNRAMIQKTQSEKSIQNVCAGRTQLLRKFLPKLRVDWLPEGALQGTFGKGSMQ